MRFGPISRRLRLICPRRECSLKRFSILEQPTCGGHGVGSWYSKLGWPEPERVATEIGQAAKDDGELGLASTKM